MSMEVQVAQKGLTKHFKEMCEQNEHLFIMDVDKNDVWNVYLEAIPAQHNKIYITKREYDCTTCRHFVRDIGNVVAIKDGKITTIWDFKTEDSDWNIVFQKVSEFLKQKTIKGIFISKYSEIGTKYNLKLTDDNQTIKFEHFHLDLPQKFVFSGRDTLDTQRSQYTDIHHVFKRSLDELSMEAVDCVLDLINQGSLYKGDEFKRNVTTFRNLKKDYDKLNDDQKEIFAWEFSVSLPQSIAKIRNTAIGTLLIDISEGIDLETAVSKYESVTAPSNYKRSKPIFTKQMLEDAQKTITELGYLNCLERRYANADDITVNNIIFSNKDTAKRIQGSVSNLFEELGKEVKTSPKKFDRVEEIPVEKFVKDVVPNCSEIEAYVEGRHIPNFVSLIAPIDKDSKSMFKWNNNFSWAYNGNVTDSMVKQNVKNAGGKVDGVLRFSIQWNDLGDWDRNDEDAHCIEPSGNEIYYSNTHNFRTGGNLDVDITRPKENKPAVENITWPNIRNMEEGIYQFFVHCYAYRGGQSGFRAEIEFNGEIYSFDYSTPLKQDEKVQVAEVTFKNGQFSIKELLPSNCSSKEVWGIKTNSFTPVTVMCYSPNYWDEQHGIGNKHYFFMLKDCVNTEKPNSFYNEFLCDELYPKHRKVMEALAYKANVQDTEDQLSGLGFSSTLRNDLIVKVKGATERVLRVKF